MPTPLERVELIVNQEQYSRVLAMTPSIKQKHLISAILLLEDSGTMIVSDDIVAAVITHINRTATAGTFQFIKRLSEIRQLTTEIVTKALSYQGIQSTKLVESIELVLSAGIFDAVVLQQLFDCDVNNIQSLARACSNLLQGGILTVPYFNRLIAAKSLPAHHADLITILHRNALVTPELLDTCLSHKSILTFIYACLALEQCGQLTAENVLQVRAIAKPSAHDGRMVAWLAQREGLQARNVKTFAALRAPFKENLINVLMSLVANEEHAPAQLALLPDLFLHHKILFTNEMLDGFWSRIHVVNVVVIHRALELIVRPDMQHPHRLLLTVQPPIAPNNPNINYAQSVHNSCVSDSLRESIANLKARFRGILSNKQDLTSIIIMLKQAIATNEIANNAYTRIIADLKTYTHNDTRIIMMILLAYIAVLDYSFRRNSYVFTQGDDIQPILTAELYNPSTGSPEAKAEYDSALAIFLEALSSTQRAYNTSDDQADLPACAIGTFVRIGASINEFHPLCNIRFITKETINLKFQQLGRGLAFKCLTDQSEDAHYDDLAAQVRESESIAPVLPSIERELKQSLYVEFEEYFKDPSHPDLSELLLYAGEISFDPSKIPNKRSSSLSGFFSNKRIKLDTASQTENGSLSPSFSI